MGLPSHQVHQKQPNSPAVYIRHRPETTFLYQIVQEYWPEFQAELASHDKYLPAHVTKEFDEYLKCGRLERGFLRVRCEACHDQKLVAFSCKRRGFCPSCGARRMADSAALLVDEVLPYAVWLYHRFNLSQRDIEDLLAERGVLVSYESIRLWCNKFRPQYARRLENSSRSRFMIQASMPIIGLNFPISRHEFESG